MTRDFLDVFLPVQNNRSPHTVKAYRDGLTIFRRYICEFLGVPMVSFLFSDCTYEFLLDYLAYLRKELHYTENSANQRLAAVKSYVCYAAGRDVAIQQVWFNVSRVPFLDVPKPQRPIIEKEALAALLAAPGSTRLGIRDGVILTLLFDSAIRADELIQMSLSDMNLSANGPYILIHGKGDKERIVGITDRTARNIKEYMCTYHHDARDMKRSLFYTVIRGISGPMSERNVERIVKKYADQIRKDHPELPESVYPHMLRRTRATGLYRDGVELELISRILGHNSTDVTKRYAIPSIEMLREAMKSGSDMEQLDEKPLWKGREDELTRLCGLRP